MTVLKSVLRPVLNDILRPILFSEAVTRFFTTLVASGSMHYTIPTVTLAGDFDITIDSYSTDSTSAARILLGNSAGTNNSVFLGSENLSVRDNAGVTISTSGSPVLDNIFNALRIVKTGTDVEIFVNGVSSATGTSSASYIFNRIGIRQTTAFPFDGILANIGITDAGTPARFYPIDEDLSLGTNIADTISGQNGTAVNISESDLFTLQSNGDYLGVNRWTNPAASIGSEWTDLGGGSYRFVGVSGAFNALENLGVGTAGETTRSEFTISDFSGSGDIKLSHRDSAVAIASSDGKVSADYTISGNANMAFSRNVPGDMPVLTISDITDKRLLESA